MADLRRLVDLAVAEYPGVPLVMIGHSMGGLLTSRFAQTCRRGHRPRCRRRRWDWARTALAAPELPAATTDFSGISRDGDAVERYATDPLIYNEYKRPLLEAEMVALDRFQEQVDRLTMPSFSVGDDDPFVDYQRHWRRSSRCRAMTSPSGSTRVPVTNWSTTNRDEVIGEIVEFVNRVVAQ